MTARLGARDRLLAAADELFYAEGVQTVGIDRVIERAGVAKATLYNNFGSKDELVRAYLQGRHARTQARIGRALAQHEAPRDRLLSVFEVQAERFADPGYHGCAFASASAEARPGSAAEQMTTIYRDWLNTLFTELAAEAGARDPAALAGQLRLLYDGVGLSARLDRDPAAAVAARTAAAALLDAQSPR